jgi:hypothetical protein
MVEMKHLRLIVSALIPAVILLLVYAFHTGKKYAEVKKQNSGYIITIDSLKAENKLLNNQVTYLIKYYDSTRKKIPQPQGFAFIADSIPNTGQ